MYDGYRYAVYTDQTGRARLTPRQARRFAKKMRCRNKHLQAAKPAGGAR